MSAFATQYAAEIAWINGQDWEFPKSLAAQLARRGSLTEGQIAAVRKCMSRDKARAEPAVEVKIAGIEEAFARARSNGLKRPALYLGPFRVSPAGERSRNPGALYVKRDGGYLGKIQDGRFTRAPDCDDATASEIISLTAQVTDVMSLRRLGALAGRCCCCGMELTDPESVAMGIGPVCAKRWT